MKVEQKGHTVTIKDTQGDLVSFRLKLTHEYKTFQKHNIIVDIRPHKVLTIKEIDSFLPLSKTHKKAKKSTSLKKILNKIILTYREWSLDNEAFRRTRKFCFRNFRVYRLHRLVITGDCLPL